MVRRRPPPVALAVFGWLALEHRANTAWGHYDTIGHDLDNDFDALCTDRFLAGDAARVAEDLARYRELPGVGELVLRLHWSGLVHADALANGSGSPSPERPAPRRVDRLNSAPEPE